MGRKVKFKLENVTERSRYEKVNENYEHFFQLRNNCALFFLSLFF